MEQRTMNDANRDMLSFSRICQHESDVRVLSVSDPFLSLTPRHTKQTRSRENSLRRASSASSEIAGPFIRSPRTAIAFSTFFNAAISLCTTQCTTPVHVLGLSEAPDSHFAQCSGPGQHREGGIAHAFIWRWSSSSSILRRSSASRLGSKDKDRDRDDQPKPDRGASIADPMARDGPVYRDARIDW
ncbi:hypothetical protein GSI_11215 [Ganoderma sinense ZZ0214-1]|uniref:Uncharacterized protein n=1 Tax=Ganoderma sinense ZZ0214-1 TaxID=1077348 RepID=A0A2G8RZE8_9APHY|nr:hypothetical protein GSI_11215 [Ganoderma sinense ZZ0214-1]